MLTSQSSVSGDGTVVFDDYGSATIDGGYNLGTIDTVMYATAHQPGSDGPFGNLPPTYSFGTIDLTTGQFTPISTTGELINSLTAGHGGTLYAGGNDGNLYAISPSGTTSEVATVTVPSNSTTASLVGLAVDSAGAGGFFADSVTSNPDDADDTATLDHISTDGTGFSVIGTMGVEYGNANTGNLADGPDGNLYFDSENADDIPSLYVVNRTTGVATGIGSGLGVAYPLTLVSNGTTLYGVDTYTATNPAIYTIDTTTGAATLIGTVSGLGDGFYLDTLAPSAAQSPVPALPQSRAVPWSNSTGR